MAYKIGVCIDCGGDTTTVKNPRCMECFKKDKHTGLTRREYARNWQIKKKYGIDVDEVWAYWIACKGRCFICNKNMKQPEHKQGQSLDVVAIDHCHETGKFRGLLCNACNKGVGLLKDDILILENAIKYLKNTK